IKVTLRRSTRRGDWRRKPLRRFGRYSLFRRSDASTLACREGASHAVRTLTDLDRGSILAETSSRRVYAASSNIHGGTQRQRAAANGTATDYDDLLPRANRADA